VTVEYIGIRTGPGRIPSSDASRSARNGSTCGLWEATSTFTGRKETNRCTKGPPAGAEIHVTDDDGRTLAVADRDRQAVFAAAKARADFRRRELDHRHGTPATDRGEQPAALADDPGRVLQAERPGHVRGRDFAHAVAHHRRRLDSPRAPLFSESHLDREEGWLDDVDQLGRQIVPAERGEQRPPRQRSDHALAANDGLTEHGLRLEQPTAHADPLRALPREDEHDLRCAGAGSVLHSDRGARLGERGETLPDLPVVAADDRQPMRVMRPAEGRGVGDVGQRSDAGAGEVIRVAARLLAEGVRRPGGERQQRLGARRGDATLTALARAGTVLDGGEHHVGIGPADAEGADTGDPAEARGPGRGGGRDPDAHRVPGHLGRRCLTVEAGRNDAVLHRENDLDQACDPGGSFRVTDVGLHGSDQARSIGGTFLAQDDTERAQLHGVTRASSGAVRLDVADCRRSDAGAPVRLPQEVLLAGATRRPERAPGMAVVVHRAAQDHRVDRISVGAGA
jgi:hypothetical protein